MGIPWHSGRRATTQSMDINSKYLFNPDNLAQGYMRFLLPEGLDPDEMAWGQSERKARIAYVANFISTRRFDERRNFVTIHSPTIKRIITPAAWRHAKKALYPHWDVDASYLTNCFSMGYRWKAEWLRQGCTPHLISCPRFKERLTHLRAKEIEKMCPIELRIYLDLLEIKCTIEDIPSFLRSLPDKPGTKCENHRRSVIRGSIQQIIDQNYEITLRGTNGRLYHPLTRTPREVRRHLTIAGERAVEVDLANSQPYFMAAIFPNVRGLAESVSNGTFYKDVNAAHCHPWNLDDPCCKAELKRVILQCLYGKTSDREKWNNAPESKNARTERALEKAFPGLLRNIKDYAIKGETALANEMQRAESWVFIDDVLPKLQALGIPAIPVHDSILCRESDAPRVREILTNQLFLRTGIPAKVR